MKINVSNDERWAYNLGMIGICLIAFSYGYINDIFSKPKKK